MMFSRFSIQRFQPCQLKKLNNGGFWRAPKAWASIGVQGHAPLQKTSRYVSLRCLFLDFETTNERKPCTSLRQSSALLRPKLWQANARMPEKGKYGPESENGKESC